MPLLRRRVPHSGSVIVCLVLMLALCSVGSGCSRSGDHEPVVAQQAAPQQPSDVKPSPPVAERPRIAVLGDSLTAGLGLADTQSFPSLLQRKLDAAGLRFQVMNAGVSGDTSAGGLRRVD